MSSKRCRPTDDPKSKIQLKETTLSSDGRDLTFAWTTNEDPPATVGYFATVTDAGADGDGPAYIVGVEFLDGEPPSYFVDGSEAGTTELPLSQETPSTSFTAYDPLSTMPGIQDTFHANATFALDGPDISYCPREGEPVDYTLPAAAARGRGTRRSLRHRADRGQGS